MLTLDQYDISEQTGFALEEPYRQIPDHSWQKIVSDLPYLVSHNQLTACVEKMPIFDLRSLSCHKDVVLAHVMFSTIAQGYVCEQLKKTNNCYIPKVLSLPLYNVSSFLSVPPIMSYADSCLYNYKLIMSDKGLTLDNLDLIVKLSDTQDYKMFFLISLNTEIIFAKCIKSFLTIKQYLNDPCDTRNLNENLQILHQTLIRMKQSIELIYKKVDPSEFFTSIRPFMMGWGLSSNSEIFLEGISQESYKLYGPSAVESSILPAFDTLLGVKHQAKGTYMHKVMEYMPLGHRQFLNDLSLEPNLKQYIEKNRSDHFLTDNYNKVVDALIDFRKTHSGLALHYIVNPSKKSLSPVIGTAGSDVLPFLREIITDTKLIKI